MRTPEDWIKWAGQVAYDDTWCWYQGCPKGMDWKVAAKMLAEKCSELQQEAATANARLDKLLGTNVKEETNM